MQGLVVRDIGRRAVAGTPADAAVGTDRQVDRGMLPVADVDGGIIVAADTPRARRQFQRRAAMASRQNTNVLDHFHSLIGADASASFHGEYFSGRHCGVRRANRTSGADSESPQRS
jgi:hypothetical protein